MNDTMENGKKERIMEHWVKQWGRTREEWEGELRKKNRTTRCQWMLTYSNKSSTVLSSSSTSSSQALLNIVTLIHVRCFKLPLQVKPPKTPCIQSSTQPNTHWYADKIIYAERKRELSILSRFTVVSHEGIKCRDGTEKREMEWAIQTVSRHTEYLML